MPGVPEGHRLCRLRTLGGFSCPVPAGVSSWQAAFGVGAHSSAPCGVSVEKGDPPVILLPLAFGGEPPVWLAAGIWQFCRLFSPPLQLGFLPPSLSGGWAGRRGGRGGPRAPWGRDRGRRCEGSVFMVVLALFGQGIARRHFLAHQARASGGGGGSGGAEG